MNSYAMIDDTCFPLCPDSFQGNLRLDAVSAEYPLAGTTSRALGLLVLNGEKNEASMAKDIRNLRRRNFWLPIYLIFRKKKPHVQGPPSLALAGVDASISVDEVSDALAALSYINARVSVPVPAQALQNFGSRVPDHRIRTVALWCLRAGHRLRHRDVVSEWFQLSVRTLDRILAADCLPTVSVLLRFGQLLHAMELERQGVRTSSEIMRRLDFDPSVSLHRRISRTLLSFDKHAESSRRLWEVCALYDPAHHKSPLNPCPEAAPVSENSIYERFSNRKFVSAAAISKIHC